MPTWARPIAALATAAVLGSVLAAPALVAPAASAASAVTVTGIDVASWQHPNGAAINWPSVAAAGHSFAFIKATESTTYTNPYYASDIAAARAAGLVVGAYHFARPALPLSTATDQAKFFVKKTGTMRMAKTLPPVLDIESNDSLSVANRVAWSKRFLEKVKALTGRTPMIYSYDSYLRTRLGNSSSLAGYPLWYANYTSKPPASLPGAWNTWTMWQFTSTATVPGIKGDVDVNRFNGSKTSLLKLADGTKASPIAPGAPSALTATLASPDATLTWTKPTSDGGSPITNYVVTVDGGLPGYTPTTSFVAGPLSLGVHTVSVRAVNIVGTGPATTTTFTLSTKPTGSGTAPPAATSLSLGTPTTVDRAARTLVTVTMRRADTQQLVPGGRVEIVANPRKGATTRYLATTDQLGTATAYITPKATTALSVNFLGTTRMGAASSMTTVTVRPKPSAKLTAKRITKTKKAYLYGKVSPLYAGERVQRERYYNGAWRVWATKTVQSDGTYRFKITGPVGTYKYRVSMLATSLHLKGRSGKVTLRIVKK